MSLTTTLAVEIPSSLSKSELAEKYKVSVRTLMRWLEPFKSELNLTGRIIRKLQLEKIIGFLGPW